MSTWIIAQLTIREAQRRRILWVALIMGILFVVLFSTGMHYIVRDMERYGLNLDNELDLIPVSALSMMGLYVTNFLVVIMSVLISVAAIANEIESRLIDTLVTKPMRRWEIVLGKWLGFALMAVVYSLLLSGSILLFVYWRTGYLFENIAQGMLLMAFNAVIVMTVSILGGTRLSTLANGVLAFMLYGLAFIGGWVETIGSFMQNETAINIGIISSLLMPIEALWRKASVLFQPRNVDLTGSFAGPFAVGNEPSDAMVVYAIVYVIGLLLLAMRLFGKRDL
jgi:ABC-type transport system involved in multi-copper enzyme maturation permease subunit